jgi:hypothetical protein
MVQYFMKWTHFRPIFHFASIIALLLSCFYIVIVLIRPFDSFFAQAVSGPSIHDLQFWSCNFQIVCSFVAEFSAIICHSLAEHEVSVRERKCWEAGMQLFIFYFLFLSVLNATYFFGSPDKQLGMCTCHRE